MFRALLAPLVLLATAATPPPLLLDPVPGRIAQTEEDWARMVPFRPSPDTQPGDCDSPVAYRQLTTPDGRTVYQEVCRWVTSGLIVAVDNVTGTRRAISPGNSLALVLDGPYRGHLLVSRHLYRRGGQGSYDPVQLVRPRDGKVVLTVPGSADDEDRAVARWLKRHGWHALEAQDVPAKR